MRLACAILALSALAFGQTPGSAVVSGTVIEASSGDPVRKAIVTLALEGTPPTWATARTDGSGRFRFEKLPAGKYTLRAAKNGIGTAIYGAGGAREVGETIALSDGENRAGLTLRFIRTATVSGRVYDSDGDPVPGANVMLQRQSRNLGQPVLVNYRSAVTDDRGEYRITGVALAQYYLLLNPDTGFKMGGDHRLFAPQYFGGTRLWKNSTVLNIRSGENRAGLDFQLNAEQPYRIAGRVTGVPNLDQPSRPGAENEIQVWIGSADEDSAPHPGFGIGVSAPDYRFDFGDHIGGLYRIEARVRASDKIWAASELIDSRQAASEIVLALTPGADISGAVRIEGAKPETKPNLRINLVRAGALNMNNVSSGPDDGGHFTLQQVTRGEWALNIAPLPKGAFLKSATYGDKDVRFTRFSPEPGSDAQIQVVISMRSAKFEGQVDAGSLDSKRAGIVLAPTGDFHTLARFYYGTVTDDEGKFHLENLAPGKYRIFALEKMTPADFRNPEAADQLDALGEDIELSEGDTAQAHPKLIPTERAREALPEEVR